MVATGGKAARRRGIGSVETGLRVAAALAGLGRAAPLGEVARHAGLSASQAHRYLASLVAAGIAVQRAEGGLYDLGPAALRLGLAALARTDALARAEEALAGFAARSGRTALVAVWGDAGATVVRWLPGDPAVLTSIGLGSVLPLLRSATGQVFLAFGDAAAMERAARQAAGGAAPDLGAIRAAVRAGLLGRVDGALIPGLRAAAAPIFDAQGRLALVGTAIAAAAHDPGGDEAAAAALRAACRAATLALGGAWPGDAAPSHTEALADAQPV